MQPEVIRFFQDFYQLSDTPDGDDLYPTRFTEDATFILASRVSRGRAGKPGITPGGNGS